MNVENMKEFREFIAQLPEKACEMRQVMKYSDNLHTIMSYADGSYDWYVKASQAMRQMGFECGSAGCFLGWGLHFLLLKGIPYNEAFINQFLELTYNEARALFYDYPAEPREGWKAWMLRRLDDAIAIGRVNPLGNMMT